MSDPAAAPEEEKKIRLLLLDDEKSVVNALRRSLRREGYKVFTCNDPTEALALIKAEGIDIVVSDHLMPQMTGIEFFTLVSRLHPNVVRIMLTGQADVDMTIRAINDGKVGRFLTKPWNDDEFKRILKESAREVEIRKREEAAAPAPKAPVRPSTIKKDSRGAIVIDLDAA